MSRFFISDTHFGHANIIRFCDRPFDSVAHMNEELITRWNSVVAPDDEVFHLGDVALGPWVEWDGILTRLNGYKTLVIGNHERIFAAEKQSQQDKFWPRYAGWFDVITENITNFRLSDGTMVDMSHFPYDGDSHDGDRFTEHRLPDKGRVLLHGHTHLDSKVSRSAALRTPQVHVGADAWDYTPVSEAQVIELIKEEF